MALITWTKWINKFISIDTTDQSFFNQIVNKLCHITCINNPISNSFSHLLFLPSHALVIFIDRYLLCLYHMYGSTCCTQLFYFLFLFIWGINVSVQKVSKCNVNVVFDKKIGFDMSTKCPTLA